MADFLNPGRAIRPSLTNTALGTILLDTFGLRLLSYQELNSYDDWNFHVQVETEGTNKNIKELCPHGYVLKVLNSGDSQKTDGVEAHCHVVQAVYESGIPTPRPVPSLSGHLYEQLSLPPEADDTKQDKPATYVVRLFNFIPGTTLKSVPLTEHLCYKVGAMAGKLDRCLKGVQHVGLNGYHRKWHLDCIPRLNSILHVINDDSNRYLVSDIFAKFQTDVLDQLSEYSEGIIHGDFNEENILVDKIEDPDGEKQTYDIVAILDFEDSTKTLHVFEAAIAMAYMGILGDDVSLETASGHVLAGYLEETSLSQKELEVLPLCVCVRLAQSLLIGTYSNHIDPSSDHTLQTAVKGWPRLRQLWATDPKTLHHHWDNIAIKRRGNVR